MFIEEMRVFKNLDSSKYNISVEKAGLQIKTGFRRNAKQLLLLTFYK
jgi:hypothetical protein